jgi:hypothetical protein
MADHVRIAGVLRIIFSTLGLFVAGFVFLILGGVSLAAAGSEGALVAGVLTVILTVIGLCALPGILTGWGMLQFWPWARILGIVFAVLDLFSFPLGTALGIYSLWVLLHPDTVRLFELRGPTTPPAYS